VFGDTLPLLFFLIQLKPRLFQAFLTNKIPLNGMCSMSTRRPIRVYYRSSCSLLFN